jgi:hypothetical protein
MVQARRSDPLFVVGDFNAFQFSDGYVDIMAQVAGTASLGASRPMQPIVNPSLRIITTEVPEDQRYSFLRDGNAQLLDHALATELTGFELSGFEFARANTDFPASFFGDAETPVRSSDHDGFVIFLKPDPSVATSPLPDPAGIKLTYSNPVEAGTSILLEMTKRQPVSLRLFYSSGVPASAAHSFSGPGTAEFRIPGTLPTGWYVLLAQSAGQSKLHPIIVVHP